MDIAVVWDTAQCRGDWAVTPGDLVTDPGGLRSATLLSLFTDRVVPDYVPPAGASAERRGWWGDSFEDSPIGSRLWTLNRSKKTDTVTLLNAAQDFCNEALQWLVDAGVVATVGVTASWQQVNVMALVVTLRRPQSPPVVFNFSWAWQGT